MGNIKELVSFLEGAFTDFVAWFLNMLMKPWEAKNEFSRAMVKRVGLCIILGVALRMCLLKTPPQSDDGESDLSFVALVVFIFFCWLFYSVFIHAIARLFGGVAEMASTISVSLQVLGAIFAATNFVVVLVSRILPNPPTQWVYLPVQLMLLLVYFPIALKSSHQLSTWKVATIAILAGAVFATFNYFLTVAWEGLERGSFGT